MRFFAVWFYLGWKNVLDKIVTGLSRLKKIRLRLLCYIIRHSNYRVVLAVAHLFCRLGFVDKELKKRASVAAANKACLIGEAGGELDYAWITRRRELLDLAATYGRNKQLLAEIDACAVRLDEIVKPLHEQGHPVILAPLHMVSDILAGMVGAKAWPGQATAIVSSSALQYNDRVREYGGVNLSYCSIHEDNKRIAGNLMDAMMEAAEHQRNIMIFPDIVPDYTINTNVVEAATYVCRLFDRPAHLHSGIIRIARAISARVVFYYLHYDKGLKIHVCDAVEAKKLSATMPVIIEESMRRHPGDWALWQQHSLFFINK